MQVEARRLSDGQLVCRDSLGGPVAGLLVGDYRGDGTQQLVALSTEGEVRGYVPQPPGASGAAAVPEPDLEQLQAAITQLGHRKQVGAPLGPRGGVCVWGG
jgi:Bardet-Biedl syndrome 2 protein